MGKRILIVEDDKDIRDSLRECLEVMDYEVDEAVDGQDALNYLAHKSAPCLIFLDLMMPNLNGMDFVKAQQADPSIAKIPVVVITADGHATTKAAKLGVVAGLAKPLELDEIITYAEKFCSAA